MSYRTDEALRLLKMAQELVDRELHEQPNNEALRTAEESIRAACEALESVGS